MPCRVVAPPRADGAEDLYIVYAAPVRGDAHVALGAFAADVAVPDGRRALTLPLPGDHPAGELLITGSGHALAVWFRPR
jgi:hypothetical protein